MGCQLKQSFRKGLDWVVIQYLDLVYFALQKSFDLSRVKRMLFAKEDQLFYGDGGTVHHTGHVDVETDSKGQVVAVWFRCMVLPFEQHKVRSDRAADMRRMYQKPAKPIHGVVVEKPGD